MARKRHLTSIELFTGAGGLALGVAGAGFEHRALVEWNHDACETLRANALRLPSMAGWEVFEGDVRDFDFTPHSGETDLVAAGAPCQPFSLGGKHRGDSDHRNLFPEVFRAVREVRPRAVVVENVKGLLRSAFREYFEYILLQLSMPDAQPRRSEDWTEHKERLRRLAKRSHDLSYRVSHHLLNAADFGLPQHRERVFIVALRSDIADEPWAGITPTHYEEALLHDQWVSGDYWREHGVRRRPAMPERVTNRVEELASIERGFLGERWLTVRDALRGLPEPRDGVAHPTIANHVGNPGARTYPGHTGSPLDLPAKTLKAGDHGVPGGENTLRREDGSVRYFTVREAARLQGFPDDYVFTGAWGEGFRQLGNAVPVGLARAVASSVSKQLAVRPMMAQVA